MTAPCIGVIGASGAVGRAVARRLRAAGRLRLGGRRIDQVRQVVCEDLQGAGEAVSVELSNPRSLRAFCDGCQVVINGAGPSRRVLDLVARAALSAGAGYVDPGGDEPVYERLSAEPQLHGRSPVVLSAGLLPGLSGLLPRYLAASVDRPTRLCAHYAVFDCFTHAAAVDYLTGVDPHQSLSAWRQGRRRARALVRRVDVELPFFSDCATAHPFLNQEGERVARALGLAEAEFYSVFPGQRVLATLGRLLGGNTQLELATAAGELQRAAELDLAGRTPYVRFLFELENRTETRSLLLAGGQAAELTAAMAALATEAVLAGAVPPGVHYAAEVLDGARVVAGLRALPATTVETFTQPLAGAAAAEEGAL